MLVEILIILGILYLIVSIVVYFLANSNVIPSRRNKVYTIGFGAQKYFIPSVIDPNKSLAYWKAQQEGSSKNVILLHGFTRTTKSLESRGEIYWDLGYNVYLVDNLGHGYSSDQLYPSGYRYSREVKNLIEELNIDSPVLHGLSMGAIASSVIAQLEPHLVKAIVCEALPIDFQNLYRQLLRYLHIPYQLFPWIEWVSRQFNWKQFDELGITEEEYDPTNINCPIFLIHSKSDRLFKYEDHFIPLKNQLSGSEDIDTWLVPDAGHTNMINNPSFSQKLNSFIQSLD